jgi:hypothetical protein
MQKLVGLQLTVLKSSRTQAKAYLMTQRATAAKTGTETSKNNFREQNERYIW